MATRSMLTVEEFARLPEDDLRHELDEGELIVSPLAGWLHGMVQSQISCILGDFAKACGLGDVLIGCGFLLAPHTVRGPDVSFIREDRLASLDESSTWPAGTPDLAVEIVSPSDAAAQLERKVRQYLRAGAQAVWIVYPESRRVHVFEPGGAVRILEPGSVLEAPQVLPGFSAPVESLFA